MILAWFNFPFLDCSLRPSVVQPGDDSSSPTGIYSGDLSSSASCQQPPRWMASLPLLDWANQRERPPGGSCPPLPLPLQTFYPGRGLHPHEGSQLHPHVHRNSVKPTVRHLLKLSLCPFCPHFPPKPLKAGIVLGCNAQGFRSSIKCRGPRG